MDEPLFREPLHVFSIPPQVLNQLVPRPSPLESLANTEEPQENSVPEDPLTGASSKQASAALTCTLCQSVTFADVQAQRSHFRSDWHRYNVKTRLSNSEAGPVSETEFASLVEGLEDSLSGSASSGSEDSEDSSSADAVRTLMSKNKKLRSRSHSPSHPTAIPKSPVLWFYAPNIRDTQFGIYSTILPSPPSQLTPVQQLQAMQNGGEQGRYWALFMVAGGHFAGVIVRVCWPDSEGGEKGKKIKSGKRPEMEITKHKTFHRYTTRKKQGGSQSVNDNAKGAAISAGAMLRRYGEQALREEIQALLAEWKEDIDVSERIFIRASVANKKIFYDYDSAVITKGDTRLRTFPFPTRRPTQVELIRCLTELTRVKVSRFSEEDLRAQDEALLASLPKPRVQPRPIPADLTPKAPSTPKLSKGEEIYREKLRRFLDMTRKGRLEPMKGLWEKEKDLLMNFGNLAPDVALVDARLPDWLDEPGEDGGAGATLLQVASAAAQDDVVRWLLEDLRADPRIPLPISSKIGPSTNDKDAAGNVSDTESPKADSAAGNRRTAYDVAASKPTRDVFRRCAWKHPEWWDWLGEGRVSSVLSPAMEEEQDKKKGDKRKGMREKAKARELARAKEEAALAAKTVAAPSPPPPKANPTTGPKKLGGAGGGESDRMGVAGLTPEMRARIERERRARAAEARLRGTSIGS